MDDGEETDKLVAVLPIHFANTLAPDVHLHQFPLLNRQLQVPASAQLSGKRISARVKPEVRRLELHIPADTRPEVWNSDRAGDLGAAQIDDDAEKKQDGKKLKEGKDPPLSEIRLQSEQIPQRGCRMLGVVRDGKLNLHPISETHQFRPTLTYLDILSHRNKRLHQAGSDFESDSGPPLDPDEPVPAEIPKKEKATETGKEVQVSARKTDDKGGVSVQGGLSAVRRDMLRAIRAEEDEEWTDLLFFDVTTKESAEAFETVFSQSTDILATNDDVTIFLKDIKGL